MNAAPAATVLRPQRILVRGVNWLGDAVMTTPALQRLREALPSAHIALLTQQKLADLWEHHPGVDEVIPFAPDEGPRAVARRLRAKNFQAVLVLPNSPRSALEGWLARIPERIGYRRPWCSWLLTEAVPLRPEKVRMPRRSASEVKRLARLSSAAKAGAERVSGGSAIHQVRDYLHLVARLGAKPDPLPPQLVLTGSEVQDAHQRFLSDRQPGQTKAGSKAPPVILGLNPGAEYGPAKRWSAESFAEVAREVSRRVENCLWVAFGGAGDREICAMIARLAGVVVLNLAGETSLRQLMGLLKLCRVVLTNDTGPMHVAAALGTPVVVPFGSTSPELTGPGLPGDPRHHLIKSTAPCSPCFRRVCPIDFRCMAGVRPEIITEAILQSLAAR